MNIDSVEMEPLGTVMSPEVTQKKCVDENTCTYFGVWMRTLLSSFEGCSGNRIQGMMISQLRLKT